MHEIEGVLAPGPERGLHGHAGRPKAPRASAGDAGRPTKTNLEPDER